MAQSFSAPFSFYNTLRLGVISMSYFTADQIGKALSKARVSAGLSQREIAIRVQKGERTVQSWEKGNTSPDSDEIMDWCTACGVSPITVFMEVMHPDLYAVPDGQKEDAAIDKELHTLVQALPPLTRRGFCCLCSRADMGAAHLRLYLKWPQTSTALSTTGSLCAAPSSISTALPRSEGLTRARTSRILR